MFMAAIIKNRQVTNDTWQLLRAGADLRLPAVPPAGDVIVSLAQWLAQRDALLAREGGLGVWLANTDDPAAIAGDLQHFGVVAVDFPHFTDGRGASIARLLRERHGWTGELRAIGDVIRDAIFYLSRCGFDAFVLKAGEDPAAALSAFNDFSEAYQTSVERPQPLFRRRVAAAGAAAE
jgi:uncharacterized protein (DUF934 family)